MENKPEFDPKHNAENPWNTLEEPTPTPERITENNQDSNPEKAAESDQDSTPEDPVEQSNEQDITPPFDDDPDQYSEDELLEDPLKRFCVNPKDFPLFVQQGVKKSYNSPLERQPLDLTLGRYVTCTADMVSVIESGNTQIDPFDNVPESDKHPYDHIVYLDKSARPLCWMTNVFWDDFSKQKRPEHSFLAIDRAPWLQAVGLDSNSDGRRLDGNNSPQELYGPQDFLNNADKISKEDLAKLRALYIEGGIENEDVDQILNTPASLDGKRVLIVDEVGRTGTTQAVAKCLIEKAFPSCQVDTYAFWNPGTVVNEVNGESEIDSVPVWYNANSETGRGIGDIDPKHYADRYNKYPNAKTRAQKFGAAFLSSPLNLATEKDHASRSLMTQIKKMHEEYQEGHIIPTGYPRHYNFDKIADHLSQYNVKFSPDEKDKTTRNYIVNKLSQRKPYYK